MTYRINFNLYFLNNLSLLFEKRIIFLQNLFYIKEKFKNLEYFFNEILTFLPKIKKKEIILLEKKII
jgi:hypothetical protein